MTALPVLRANGDVDGYVGPRFIDHADHADGDAAAAGRMPLGNRPSISAPTGSGSKATLRIRGAAMRFSSSNSRSSKASLRPLQASVGDVAGVLGHDSRRLGLQLAGNRQRAAFSAPSSAWTACGLRPWRPCPSLPYLWRLSPCLPSFSPISQVTQPTAGDSRVWFA